MEFILNLVAFQCTSGLAQEVYEVGSTFSFPGSLGFFLGKFLPCFHSQYWTHNILTLFSFQFIMFNTMITPFSFQFIEHYLTPEVWTLGWMIPLYTGGTKSFFFSVFMITFFSDKSCTSVNDVQLLKTEFLCWL